ncbi:hypothetical protein KJ903_04130 [Patescibacteria group bacterium]|nr:hypothetical protein [Patescibacteria group bacterium]
MKEIEKEKARKLRQLGWSLGQIKHKLDVSKSSVSIWVRDIKLTSEQKQELSKKGLKKEIIEKRRETRLRREKAKRQIVIDRAKYEIKKPSREDLKLIGIALYWAEGSKTQRGVVQFSNSDPLAVKVMMRFFKEVCKVPKEKFRGHIYIHPHLSIKRALGHWHKISRIPKDQFFKTSTQKSRASKNKKDSLPFGTFSIEICDTKLFLTIKGWIEGVQENLLNMPG